MGGKRRGDAGDRDWYQGADGIAADHQLEGVEDATQGGVEGGGDRRGGPTSDHGAQRGPAQLQAPADRARHRAAELGHAGLEPDRGAKPHGTDGQPGDDQAVLQRHDAAVERIGLDHIEGFVLTPATQEMGDDAIGEPAAAQHHERPPPDEHRLLQGVVPRTDAVEDLMQQGDRPAHGDDPGGGEDPRHHRQEDEEEIVVADLLAEAAPARQERLGLRLRSVGRQAHAEGRLMPASAGRRLKSAR